MDNNFCKFTMKLNRNNFNNNSFDVVQCHAEWIP